jgi:hypothetical protein
MQYELQNLPGQQTFHYAGAQAHYSTDQEPACTGSILAQPESQEMLGYYPMRLKLAKSYAVR